MDFLRNRHGLDVVGVGYKIMFFASPSLIGAVLAQVFFPGFASLPASFAFLRPVGFLVLSLGLVSWAAAVVQLLSGFPRGVLITSGMYGVVRNPIYSSVTFLVLPGVSLVLSSWVFFVVSIFLYVGVLFFIGSEEEKLLEVFGGEYTNYMKKVDRMIPFKKP